MDAADVIEDGTMATLGASAWRDPLKGPVTPERLAQAQALVAAHEQNVRDRNALVRRAAQDGWNDREIVKALSDGAPISTFQVARIRKGISNSGRQAEYDRKNRE